MEAGRQTEMVEIDRIALNRVVKAREALRITPRHFTLPTGCRVMVTSDRMNIGNFHESRDGRKIRMENKKVESGSRKILEKIPCLNSRIQMY